MTEGQSKREILKPPENPRPFVIDENLLEFLDYVVYQAGPAECAGFIIEIGGHQQLLRMDNELVKKDPVKAEEAYEMNPVLVYWYLQWLEANGGRIVAVYHSHPNRTESRLSETDEHLSKHPILQDAVQLVISAQKGTIYDHKAFAWNQDIGQYQETRIITNQNPQAAA